MTMFVTAPQPAFLNPDLEVSDPTAARWLTQVTLRLRREVAWCWHSRGDGKTQAEGVLPPFSDAAVESLDLTRHADAKRRFFSSDVTARYLGKRMIGIPPAGVAAAPGSWAWLARHAGLDEAAEFILALALAARLDAAMGPVFACCQNDAGRSYPTLALAQRLWDDPRAIAACSDPGHPIRRFGLLTSAGDGREANEWLQPLEMPALIAQALADPIGFAPALLETIEPDGRALSDDGLAVHLAALPPQTLQIVPLAGGPGADFGAWAAALAKRCGRRVVRLATGAPADRAHVQSVFLLCWLRGLDLLVPKEWQDRAAAGHAHDPWFTAASTLPVRCYVPLSASGQAKLPETYTAPTLHIPELGYAARLERLQIALGTRGPALAGALKEAARRFRLDEIPFGRVTRALRVTAGPLSAAELHALCRAEADCGMNDLAQPVKPRFTLEELVLPRPQARQIAEVVQAMRALTRVHYEWGTARPWNEGGLAVLFCGASGTGKTMAAEALAATLALPMYRVDLSQVINKYIGETEKNLARIFNAAEASDCILFFDEADALFGKRMDVRDAHDRFANIEVSYLLERMERFKGLAILATNRRKDVDDAFTRRLRYVIEFPLPGPAERERIWRQVFPSAIDVSALDFTFLGQHFDFSGGHIRSAAFNACLQRAGQGEAACLTMPDVLHAIRREFGKLNRIAQPEQFGRYAHLVRDEE